jgi:guanylate kinase
MKNRSQNPETKSQRENSAPLLILISAPSGGGKTTLCDMLLAACPHMTRAVTCTTREPRKGEKDGVDYYFLEAGNFLKRLQAGNFLEHATVYGNSYGLLKSELLGKLREGKDVLLNVDVQGAATIRDKALADPELSRALVTVFLTPPTLEELEQRLKRRGADAAAVIKNGWAWRGRRWRSGKISITCSSARASRRTCGGCWRSWRRKKCAWRVRMLRSFDRADFRLRIGKFS